MTFKYKTALALTAMLAIAVPANAALTVFQTFNGSYGLSTDGGGSTGASYGVSAFVPVGATVTAAYLYQSNNTAVNQPLTFNGNSLSFSPSVINASDATLSSSRADVTSIVASLVNGGMGGTYDFTVGEASSFRTDGTALVVVYSLASLASQTVAILDGFSATGGDVTTLNFAEAIDPTEAGFTAEMRLGIGYSFPNQSSTVNVNGTTITNEAGNFDDGVGANGGLITVGGNDDPFSSLLPSYQDDHERYNIAPYLNSGDTSVTVRTNNPTGDDNIFLATFVISGNAGVNGPPPGPTVPEPATWAMMIIGFGMIGASARYRRRGLATAFA